MPEKHPRMNFYSHNIYQFRNVFLANVLVEPLLFNDLLGLDNVHFPGVVGTKSKVQPVLKWPFRFPDAPQMPAAMFQRGGSQVSINLQQCDWICQTQVVICSKT